MAAVVIRNLPEATHRALKRRAKLNGRSTEAEIRDILQQATSVEKTLGVGDELVAFGRRFGGIELDVSRDRTDSEPLKFE